MKRLAPLALAVLLLTGCAGDESAAPSETTTTPTPAATVGGRVYWLREGRVWPVARELNAPAVAASALTQLWTGPTDGEAGDLDLATELPVGADAPSLAIEDGVATLEAPGLSRAALAQVVYTLTQFPTVDSVEIDGKSYTRADVEDQTPAILVESPLAFEEIQTPLRVTGTANTFEATFEYELTDTDGKIVDRNFVTATSGTGTRGTFDFTTKPCPVPFDGVGSLIVFERSAKDGSRIHLVEIPVRMKKTSTS